MKVYLPNEAATAALARQVWDILPDDLGGWTLLLRGELGAGKSTFARALITAAGHKGAVPSPTYTLVEPYSVSKVKLYHIDLYRIADEEELRYLGWDELDDGFRLVEWPERAPGLREQADLELCLAYQDDGRVAEITAVSQRGEAVARALSSAESKS
ncbi:MAG: tRNA (adenosine(37)-N6)-threonylcarbamoyltransferase complex ATPase subunit type 1 TsaE [Woeseiaceae bacterium]